MRNISRIISILLIFCSGVKAEPIKDLADELSNQMKSTQTIRMAVLSFPYIDGYNLDGSKIVQERLITALTPNSKFSVLERSLLSKILEEKKLELNGVFDEETTTKLGRMLGIQVVLTGTLIDLTKKETEINARIINVETGKIIASGKTTISKIWKDKNTSLALVFEPARLPEIKEVETPGSDFKIETEYADIETLEKYDAVARFDKSEAVPLEKAGRWKSFASSCPRYKDLAMKRAREWEEYDKGLKKAEELKAQKSEAMKKDYQTLKRYLALTIISPKQKSTWAERFLENYGTGSDNTYKDEISRYLLWIDAKTPMGWDDANKYCKEIGRRLPTKTEIINMYSNGVSGFWKMWNKSMYKKWWWIYGENSSANRPMMGWHVDGTRPINGYVRCVLQ